MIKAEYIELFKDKINIDANGHQILLTAEQARQLVLEINLALAEMPQHICEHDFEWVEGFGFAPCLKCGKRMGD